MSRPECLIVASTSDYVIRTIDVNPGDEWVDLITTLINQLVNDVGDAIDDDQFYFPPFYITVLGDHDPDADDYGNKITVVGDLDSYTITIIHSTTLSDRDYCEALVPVLMSYINTYLGWFGDKAIKVDSHKLIEDVLEWCE